MRDTMDRYHPVRDKCSANRRLHAHRRHAILTGLCTLLLSSSRSSRSTRRATRWSRRISAAAAILAGSLSRIPPIANAHYLSLADMIALTAAMLLLLTRIRYSVSRGFAFANHAVDCLIRVDS